MSRVLLFVLLGLVGLVVVERLSGEADGDAAAGSEVMAQDPGPGVGGAPEPGPPPTRAPVTPPTEVTPPQVAGPASEEPETLDSSFVEEVDPADAPNRTPTIERMARLESRRRLFQSARYTFIDSLLITPDSVLRRWPVRHRPLSVYTAIPDSFGGQSARAHRAVELAMGRWAAFPLGVTFRSSADSANADIGVAWISKFETDRSGQAEILYDTRGVIRHASVTLAFHDPSGVPLNDEELGIVATHEFGHALGLPHSGNPRDLMFPTSSATVPSRRDRATAVLIYSLIPGSLRQP